MERGRRRRSGKSPDSLRYLAGLARARRQRDPPPTSDQAQGGSPFARFILGGVAGSRPGVPSVERGPEGGLPAGARWHGHHVRMRQMRQTAMTRQPANASISAFPLGLPWPVQASQAFLRAR